MKGTSQITADVSHRRDNSLPSLQPRRGSRSTRRSQQQLPGKPGQVAMHIDVVERIGEADRELQPARTRQQIVERTASSHSIAMKKLSMGRMCSDQIIAAIVRRSNHNIVSAERFECAVENGSRQMWAVAIEGNHALL